MHMFITGSSRKGAETDDHVNVGEGNNGVGRYDNA